MVDYFNIIEAHSNPASCRLSFKPFRLQAEGCSQTLDKTDSLGGQNSVWHPHVQVPVMLSLGIASSSVQSANLRSWYPHQILCSSGNAGFQGSFHLDPWSCPERAGLLCLAIVRCLVYKGKGFGLVLQLSGA